MEHLTHETLARLVDERPDPDEREHLKACNRCAEEFRALRLQSDALGGLAALRPPSGDWESLPPPYAEKQQPDKRTLS